MAETAQAIAAKEQTRFDQADRDRIRRALLRYMEENRIGVPTLQKLVAAANDLALDRLPLKTLQRFLADTHRSNDIMVRFCYRFAADLPDDDPLSELGEALTGFFGVRGNPAEWQVLSPDLPGDYAGFAEPAVEGMVAASPPRWIPYSTLTIVDVPAGHFASARESIHNWNRSESAVGPAVRHLYEGVVLHPTGSLFVLMRNVLTAAPRLYWLEADANASFKGHSHESITTLSDKVLPVPFRSDRIAFKRSAEGEAS